MKDRWTEHQKRIFEGLSAIGQEIAGFYEAGLEIYFGTCPNGAYFLFHAAREIDGGLRDVLAVDYSPEDNEQDKNKKSILFSLGATDLEGLANDWFRVSKELHRYAHRHGAWKSPRSIEEVKPIWNRFENVLERLVGSYYAIIERIERIGKIAVIEGGVIETLSNILTIPTYYNYFFGNEKDIKWFDPLKEKGFFSPEQIKFDEHNDALFWNVLYYLECVSKQVGQNPNYGRELIDIIESNIQFSSTKKRINNYYIWLYAVKILNNLPIKIIQDNLSLESFRRWLSVWTDYSKDRSLAISDIGNKLLPKFLEDTSTPEYAFVIIDSITRIRVDVESSSFNKREDAVFVWDPYWVRDAFNINSHLIGQKCTLKIVLAIADKLRKALEYEQKWHYSNIIVGEDVYRIEVRRVLAEGIKAGEIEFKDGQYDCLVKQFTQDQLKSNPINGGLGLNQA